jgi:glycosyltransferase involved in cell wall biosynthesis
MRLLFVHERMGSFGGAEANVLVTADAFRQRGHSVGLMHGPHLGHDTAGWHEIFPARFPVDLASSADDTARAMAEFEPDVVFLHKFSDSTALNALIESGRPVIRMVHDHDLYCMRGYKYNVVTRKICQRAASAFCVFPCGASVARNAGDGFPLRWVSYGAKRREIDQNKNLHRLIVASSYMRNELLRNGFTSEQIEIHAPVPRAAESSAAPTFSDRNLIVYAGQIIRGKGVDVLLQSLAKVTTKFECVILGDGSQRAECERLSARLGLQNRVTFAGFVPQARIAAYYRDASLAVMSSLWPEPFGATGLEAMRCGLPVVAFEAGGISEWLLDGVNGFLVPWMDRTTFATRVESLLRDKPLARRLGEAGRKLADERFNFGGYIDGLETLFRRAATQSPARHAELQGTTP